MEDFFHNNLRNNFFVLGFQPPDCVTMEQMERTNQQTSGVRKEILSLEHMLESFSMKIPVLRGMWSHHH